MCCSTKWIIINSVTIIGLIQAAFVGYIMFSKNQKPSYDFKTSLSKDYGYGGKLEHIRKHDMKHMNGSVYLDYTGSGLYLTSQMKDIFSMYEKTLFANPHSLSPASSLTTEMVEEARDLVLDFVGADPNEYTVIFTASATASLRLLAESFPWSKDSLYLYTRDNHNSVLGIRRWAMHWGAKFRTVDLEDLSGNGNKKQTTSEEPFHLFAYPTEENFAGKKYPLDLVQKFKSTDFGERFAKGGRWYVLLDAAAFLSTNKLNLKEFPADFVVMSFYKIFGFPNLGALVVRNDAMRHLRKMGFSGGTVVIATCGTDYALFQPRGCSKFEDGTVPFLSIVALNQGFKKLNELGIDNINKHTWCVTRELFTRLNALRHSNGRPAVRIYGNHFANDPKKQGSIMTFNFLNSTGGFVGYNEVMKNAAAENINIRVGCFCNPGGCTVASNLNDEQVQEYYSKKTSCHDSIDIVNGVPLGAVRASIGAYTNMEDIEIFTSFVKKYFVE